MIKPWQTVDSKAAGDFRVFTVRQDSKISPRTGQSHDFYVLSCPDWVNVVAITPDRQVVMIEQYRHGTNTVELEIPGGVMDSRDASPAAAGIRELREETGYEGEQPRIIGKILPNPAIMSNTCHTLLVENAQLKHPVEWDHGEDIITRLVPVTEIPKLIKTGQIRHSLVVVALYHFELLGREIG